MATYTPNFSLTMPDYAEPADVEVLNGNTSQIDSLIYQGRRMAVGGYDSTATYNTGDLVEYSNALYRCKEDGVTGTWDSTKWELTTLADEIESKGEGGADVTKEVSGNPVEFTDGANAPLVKCDVTISPQQDLHGYDKPWVGGAGKNLIPMTVSDIKTINSDFSWSGNVGSKNGFDFTIQTDSDGNVNGVSVSGAAVTTSSGYTILILGQVTVSSGTYMLNGITGGAASTYRLNIPGVGNYTDDDNELNLTAGTYSIRFAVRENGNQISGSITPMFRLSTETDPTFAPYSNICDISGYSSVDVNVADSALDTPQTYTINLGGTYYSGKIDAVRGVLVATSQMEVFDNTATISFGRNGRDNWYYNVISAVSLSDSVIPISNKYEGAIVLNDSNYIGIYKLATGTIRVRTGGTQPADTSAFVADLGITPLQVLYTLPTPIEIPLTPTTIKSLLGNNTMWTDGDTLEVKYITKDFQPIVDLIEANASEPYSDDYTLDTEIEVGTWVDGSTLYRKTKEITGNKNAGYEGTIYTAGSGEHIVKLDGCIYNDYYSGMAYPINMAYSTNNGTMAFSTYVTGADAETVLFRNGWSSAISKIYLVVYYTKSSS